MKRVLFITNYLSPYRTHFFAELGKYMAVTVLMADRREEKTTRSADWYEDDVLGFHKIQLSRRLVSVHGRDLCWDVIDWVRKDFDHIVVCGYSSPTAILAMLYMRLHKIPFYMEVDGGLIREDSRLKYRIKRALVSLPDAWICSGRNAAAYLTHYGARAEDIHYYPFSSLWDRDVLEQVPTQQQKQQLRGELNMPEENIVISVSRFIPSKRLDMLIRSAAQLGNKVGIYLIGGEPTEEYRQLRQELGAENVHFVGFTKKAQLLQYYQAADLFALPTQTDVWGLVINEAMACGLPVITTDMCVAGLELIEDGVNGYIIPVDDQDALTQRIQDVLATDMTQMGRAALETIRPYTIENMAKTHVEILKDRS